MSLSSRGLASRWLEKCCGFVFRRAEPERMISGWTTSSRDSSKTEEAKPRGYGQIRSELRIGVRSSSCRIFTLVGLNPPGALVSLCLKLCISNERPSGYHSFSAGRCRQYLLLRKVFAGTKDSAKCIGPVHWPAAADCLTR